MPVLRSSRVDRLFDYSINTLRHAVFRPLIAKPWTDSSSQSGKHAPAMAHETPGIAA